MPKKAAKPTKKAASSKPAPKAAKAKVPSKPAKPAAPAKTAAPAKPVAKVATKAPPKAAPKPAAKAPVKAAKPEAKASSKVEVKPKVEAKAGAPANKPVAGKGPVAKGPVKPVAKGDVKGDAAPAKKPMTVVTKPPPKRPKGGPVVPVMPAGIGRLMDPSNPMRKPLISSGPKAAHVRPLGAHGMPEAEEVTHKAKSPLSPEQLAEFRVLLVKKRGELVGDINTMESQALQGGSGSLSNMPSHLAEQGSEAYDQSLSLDLAAADRKMLKEIEDAIKRIDEGTYGVCEKTGKPIKLERLRELPWARYSIEAALELERQSMRS